PNHRSSTNPKSQIPNPESRIPSTINIIPAMHQPRAVLLIVVLLTLPALAGGQGRGARPPGSVDVTVLRPARVFDGDALHEGWAVRVRGDRIDAVGPAASVSVPVSD